MNIKYFCEPDGSSRPSAVCNLRWGSLPCQASHFFHCDTSGRSMSLQTHRKAGGLWSHGQPEQDLRRHCPDIIILIHTSLLCTKTWTHCGWDPGLPAGSRSCEEQGYQRQNDLLGHRAGCKVSHTKSPNLTWGVELLRVCLFYLVCFG